MLNKLMCWYVFNYYFCSSLFQCEDHIEQQSCASTYWFSLPHSRNTDFNHFSTPHSVISLKTGIFHPQKSISFQWHTISLLAENCLYRKSWPTVQMHNLILSFPCSAFLSNYNFSNYLITVIKTIISIQYIINSYLINSDAKRYTCMTRSTIPPSQNLLIMCIGRVD